MQDQTKEQTKVFIYKGKKCLGSPKSFIRISDNSIELVVDVDESFEDIIPGNLLGSLRAEWEDTSRQVCQTELLNVQEFYINEISRDVFKLQLVTL